MPRDAVSRTAHVGTVGKNGLMWRHEVVCMCVETIIVDGLPPTHTTLNLFIFTLYIPI